MEKYVSFNEDYFSLAGKDNSLKSFSINDFNDTESIIIQLFSLKIDFYRILVLILKSIWEIFISDTHKEKNEDIEVVSLSESDNEDDLYYNNFNPDVKTIYMAFQNAYKIILASHKTLDEIEQLNFKDYDEKVYGSLIQEIILDKLFFYSVNSQEVEKFIQKKIDEQKALLNVSEQEQQEYWLAKCVWIEYQEELSELLMFLESSRLKNGYIAREFLKIFGSAYVELNEQIIRVLSIKRKIMLKDTHPEWSVKDVKIKVREIEREEDVEIERIRYDSKIVNLVEEVEPGDAIDEEALIEYKKKVKKVLKDIYFLLHPHRLMHNKDFHNLKKRQREKLSKLWDRVMEIRQQELCYPRGTIGYNMHSLSRLLEVLDKGKRILASSGLKINIGYIIQGSTIDERVEWLDKEIRQLEKDIHHTKEEIIIIENDKSILEKKAALECPSKHNEVKEEMEKKAKELKKEADELEEKFDNMFKGDPS